MTSHNDHRFSLIESEFIGKEMINVRRIQIGAGNFAVRALGRRARDGLAVLAGAGRSGIFAIDAAVRQKRIIDAAVGGLQCGGAGKARHHPNVGASHAGCGGGVATHHTRQNVNDIGQAGIFRIVGINAACCVLVWCEKEKYE